MTKPKQPKGQEIEKHWDDLMDSSPNGGITLMFNRICGGTPGIVEDGSVKYRCWGNHPSQHKIFVLKDLLEKVRGKDEYKTVQVLEIFGTREGTARIRVTGRGHFLRSEVEPFLERLGFEVLFVSSDMTYSVRDRLQYWTFVRKQLQPFCLTCPHYMTCVLERG